MFNLPIEGFYNAAIQPEQYALPVEPSIVPTINEPTRITVRPLQQEPEPEPVVVDSIVENILNKLKSAGNSAYNVGKNLAQNDAKLTEDVLNLPKITYKQLADGIARLTGTKFGEERYQTWPEKMVRSAVTLPHDAMTGQEPLYDDEGNTRPGYVQRLLDLAGMAGTGGLAGAGREAGVTLGTSPTLRPALRYGEKLYKGKAGDQHLDVLPRELQETFRQQAMNGEDISNFNFGFVNHKGQFMDREAALKYAIDNGLIDQQAGKYGALTSTLMADSSKPGVAIEALAQSKAPAFYSAVEHNIKNIQQSTMTGDQWLGTLANKPGIKPEEMQWTGLTDFLAEKKGQPVSKAELENFIQQNKVDLKEVNRGGPNIQKRIDEYQKQGYDYESATERAYADHDNTLGTKYHKYQLPGGENYREMLLTLPSKDTNLKLKWDDLNNSEKQKIIKDHNLYREDFGGDPYFENTPSMYANDPKGWYENVIAKNLPDVQSKLVDMGNTYKSSHWDEPNVLAHVRMNDRTIDGKKSLHLEEIQSDWHQQGRNYGYSNPAKVKEIESKIDKAGYSSGREDAQLALRDGIITQDEYKQIVTRGIPDAPFKKTWHELALKRMIREAAEKGYDRLSWTPGEAQAARYDLSQQVDKIAVPMVNNNGTRAVRIDVEDITPFKLTVDKKGIVTGFGNSSSSQFNGKPLSDVVGKEMADKIMKLDKPTDFYDTDLKIGGEGMKGFYDQIIPKALEKMTKEHGVKVKQGNADLPGDIGQWKYNGPVKTIDELNKIKMKTATSDGSIRNIKNAMKEGKSFKEAIETYGSNGLAEELGGKLEPVTKKQSIFYIDIPQSLKDTAMRKGFPLFSSAVPFPLIPVDGNPFNE